MVKWNDTDRGKPRYCERNCPIATFCTSRPAWNKLSENPRFRCNKPANNRLSYGTIRSENVQGTGNGPSLVGSVRGKLEKGGDLNIYCIWIRSRDSVGGIATCYWLEGTGIESRWKRDFPHPSRPALGPTQPPIQWVPGLTPGVKRRGRGVDHPPPTRADVIERVQMYLYSPSGPSWSVLGWNLPFTFTFTVFGLILLSW